MKNLECADVVELLSDYVDGELDAGQRDAVEHHLRGCDRCTRFGGEFAAVVKAVRERLGGATDTPAALGERLGGALE